MPTTLTTFRSRLYGPLGRSDTVADSLITQGVNFACFALALMFDPPELHASTSLVVGVGSTSTSLVGLTRLRLIRSIFNTTSNAPVWKMDYETYKHYINPSETGHVRFWSRDHNTLYVHPGPTVENTLTTSYVSYPLIVSAGADEVSFSYYDSSIEAYALAYAQAGLEEAETALVWQKLGDTLLLPEQIMLQVRQYLEGGMNGYNLSGIKA